MTAPVVAGRTLGLNALLVLVAIILFLLGTFGVHFGSVRDVRLTDLGLAVFAASFLV